MFTPGGETLPHRYRVKKSFPINNLEYLTCIHYSTGSYDDKRMEKKNYQISIDGNNRMRNRIKHSINLPITKCPIPFAFSPWVFKAEHTDFLGSPVV